MASSDVTVDTSPVAVPVARANQKDISWTAVAVVALVALVFLVYQFTRDPWTSPFRTTSKKELICHHLLDSNQGQFNLFSGLSECIETIEYAEALGSICSRLQYSGGFMFDSIEGCMLTIRLGKPKT